MNKNKEHDELLAHMKQVGEALGPIPRNPDGTVNDDKALKCLAKTLRKLLLGSSYE